MWPRLGRCDAAVRKGNDPKACRQFVKRAVLALRVELRSEAIAALALTDVRFLPLPPEVWSFRPGPDPDYECYDPSLEMRAYLDTDGGVRIQRVGDGTEVARPA